MGDSGEGGDGVGGVSEWWIDRGGGRWPPRVLTCHQVPNEEGLVLLVVLQHALEVLLLPLDGDLPVELVAPLLTVG